MFAVHNIDSEDPDDSSLRRSCSLSDLSCQIPMPIKNKLQQGKSPSPARFQTLCCYFFVYNNVFLSLAVSGKITKNPANTRMSSAYTMNGPLTRSSSTGVLNPSDSETENKEKKPQSRLMRPTISSQNKVQTNKGTLNRKRQSHSTSKYLLFV